MTAFISERRKFARDYEASREDEAQSQRGEFLERFPISRLPTLSLDQYAIGQSDYENFCYWVEQGTRKWAKIVGATADKFGIYFGKTRKDRRERYRYTLKFGRQLPREGAEAEAFQNVHAALIRLVEDGGARDFAAIDENPLSQMFKAKILTLYFPKDYLAICSADHLNDVATALEIESTSPSGIQYSALKYKRSSPAFRSWSDYKFAAFLFEGVLGEEREPRRSPTKPPRNHKEVDFDALAKKWRERGRKSEAFALRFEHMRLKSKGLARLIPGIKDCTSRPGFGYDFASFTDSDTPRFIEVKSILSIGKDESRFFVSERERLKALEKGIKANYYFYLVKYSSGGEPLEVEVWKGSDLYKIARLQSTNYMVRIRG